MSTALVLVSHSAAVAAGLVEVAGQMAPDVDLRAAGGTDDGRIGTSYDLVEQAVSGALEEGADAVVVLTDLGSATLTAESVLEMLDDDRVALVDAPFVEGAVAAAVAAQSGGGLDAVRSAALTAITAFAASDGPDGSEEAPTAVIARAEDAAVRAEDAAERAETAADRAENATDDGGDGGGDGDGNAAGPHRTLTLANPLGLHARPAAIVARKAAEFDAAVTINGVDAASVLALMALGLGGGAQVELAATGPDAEAAVDAVAAEITSGFGET